MLKGLELRKYSERNKKLLDDKADKPIGLQKEMIKV